MSKQIKELYNKEENFFLRDEYNEDEVKFYKTLFDLNEKKIELNNNCSITSYMGPIIKGANYYIDALRIFLSAPMDKRLHDIGIDKSIKYRTDDEYSNIPINRLYSVFGANRVFNFKGKVNNLDLNDYIVNYEYMTDLIINEILDQKDHQVFVRENPLEPFLDEHNIKLLIGFYQKFSNQYSISQICTFANDKIKEDVEKLDNGTDDYIERSKDIVKEILERVKEHKDAYKLRLNEVTYLIKHLMAFRLLPENIGKEVVVESNIFKKPMNPTIIKNISEKRTNLNNLLLHQLQYYTEEKNKKLVVYINLNKELCTVLEIVLNNFDRDWEVENLNPDEFANKYILNATLLEEYMLNSMIEDPAVGNSISNIYELLLLSLDMDNYNTYFRALMSLMYQLSRFDGSYNLLEHIQSIMNTTIIELPNSIEEYEYNRYIRNIYDSELIASNLKDNILTVGAQNYLIPCNIDINQTDYILICKIPAKDKSINMFDSNTYYIHTYFNSVEKYKEYKKKSYMGIPYIESVNTQYYKDFESIVNKIPLNGQFYNKIDMDGKESYKFLLKEMQSELFSIEELYIVPDYYKLNINTDYYKITKLLIDNFRVFYRDFSSNELELIIANGKIDIVPDNIYCSAEDIILKEYEENKKENNDKINKEIGKIKNELELVNIQLGIKDSFSWDSGDKDPATEYADDNLNKNFFKNKNKNKKKDEEELLDVFANEDDVE